MTKLFSLAPVVGAAPKVLILGSMPGSKSLELQEYYGFKRNQFWQLMAEIFEFDRAASYAARISALLENNVALWDLVSACERVGSLDKDIKHMETNDIPAFIAAHPTITTVILNGGKARDIYKKHFMSELRDIEVLSLYSTSPASTIAYSKKLLQWSIIKKCVER